MSLYFPVCLGSLHKKFRKFRQVVLTLVMTFEQPFVGNANVPLKG